MPRLHLAFACGLLLLTGCGKGISNLPSISDLQRMMVDRVPMQRAVADVPPAQSSTVRVMSFNVRTKTMLDLGNGWSGRRRIATETIRQFDPDVLGTQECRLSQAKDLQGQLPEYSFSGLGRSDGWDSGEMCGIFFKRSRFQEMDGGYFWLSETPDEPGSKSWGAGWPRMVTWVKLQPTNGGRAIYVFNTHLDVMSAEARVNSAKLIRNRIDAIAGHSPVILTGDFNAAEGSEPYRQFVQGQRLVDTYRDVNHITQQGEGTRHGFHGKRSGERIDWILTTHDFDTVSAAIVHANDNGKYPSDHFPVTAVLRMPSPYALR